MVFIATFFWHSTQCVDKLICNTVLFQFHILCLNADYTTTASYYDNKPPAAPYLAKRLSSRQLAVAFA